MPDNLYASGREEDLPRTVRQQKEARARDQHARDVGKGPRQTYRTGPHAESAPSRSQMDESFHQGQGQLPPGEDPPATVTRMDLPFFHMMGFFIKAVFAAFPALILAVVMMMAAFWVAGQVVEHFAPWLVKMRIVVTFPN